MMRDVKPNSPSYTEDKERGANISRNGLGMLVIFLPVTKRTPRHTPLVITKVRV